MLPIDWRVSEIGDVAETSSGTTPSRSQRERYYAGGVHSWVKTLDLNNAEIQSTAELVTDVAIEETSLHLHPTGSVLVAMYGGLRQIGRTGLLRIPAAVNQAITAIRPSSTSLCPEFLLFYLNYRVGYWQSVASSSRKDPNITGADVRAFKLPLPAIREQQRIATVLSDTDALIDSLEQLLTKKRQIKQGAMQELLTGKRRLPGFSREWEPRRLEDVADPAIRINHDAAQLPVITCSKHLGFVDSLGFFKNQVFSNDTSTYKIVSRGQLAYPANHIEEGSIGYQDLYEEALVSPIYVVFQPRGGISGKFLHRLLKLPKFLPVFGRFTSSSVNRRGSLRWPMFSSIEVSLPAEDEQCAVIQVVEALEVELIALESRLTKARALKQAMAQALLTGRIRLNPATPA